MKKIIAIVLVAAILLGGGFLGYKIYSKNKTASSQVEVSINPDVVFTVNEAGKVMSVQAKNEDGQTVLANVDVNGMKIEAAVDILVKESIISGHFSFDGQQVNVTVNGKSDKQNASIEESVKKAVQSVCEEIDIQCNVVINDFSELKSEAEKLGVSAKKYALISEAKILAPEKTMSELKEMDESELIKLIADKREEYKGLAYDQYNAIIEGADTALNEILNLINSVKDQIDSAESTINSLLEKYSGELQEAVQPQINATKELIKGYEKKLQTYIDKYEEIKAEKIAEYKKVANEAMESAKQTLKTAVETSESKINSKLLALQEAGKLSEKQVNEWKELIEKNKQ